MRMDFHDFECQCSIHSSTIYSSYYSWNGISGFIVFDIVFCNEVKKGMSKQLSRIDELYKKTVSNLAKDVRIDYCEMVIDKAQLILENGKGYLMKKHKEELLKKITVAQNEIEQIHNGC